MTQINFNNFTYPEDIARCPYDSKHWTSMTMESDDNQATVYYRCGTTRLIEADGMNRLSQSDVCVRNQLIILRDQTEPQLLAQLEQAQGQVEQDATVIASLGSQLAASQVAVAALRQQLADMERRQQQASGFRIQFGQPVDKGV